MQARTETTLSKGNTKHMLYGIELNYVYVLVGRPPQVDLVPARYIFFPNVPIKMRENLDNMDN